jgi:hypothetical protein
MKKLMAKCPSTGKLFFTGKEYDPGRLAEITAFSFSSQKEIIHCPHCGQDHDPKKEKPLLAPECPLCDSPATSDLRDNGNIFFFHCDKCTDYFISLQAANRLQKELHRKAYFARVAASRKGKETVFSLILKGGELHPDTISRTSYPK